MFQPALIGGVVNGVLSGLPVINFGNVCCCLWVIVGGAVAAYMLQQKRETPINAGDGAAVGALAGVIGAVVNSLVSIPMTLLMGPMQQRMFEQLANNPDMPAEFQRFQDMFASGAMTGVMMVAGFFIALTAGLIFSTLGGVLGALIFKKSQPLPPYPGAPGPLPGQM